ncbi:gag-Pol polyprotein [Nephila pilipes]|uniref:Gag-Pol polyprotein n=1 Tax=Nephila pilipes TaxID=299642 RepID=A0A8X6QUC1_NEPPI|nr:gag-Pol polyprotein [Nephila pilipes]
MKRIIRKMDMEMMKSLLERLAEQMTELKTEKKGGQEEMRINMKAGKEELKKNIVRIKEEFSNIIQEKMNAIKNKITLVEIKVLKIKESLEKKVLENIEKAFENVNKEIKDMKKQISNGHEEPNGLFMPSLVAIKLLTFDGKTSWQVYIYKTQFTMVLEANGWNPRTKAFHLAASLRGEAADIIKTFPEEQRHDFQALSGALELRVRDPETQKALRFADVKDIGSALVYAHKIEADQQAARKDRRSFRAVSAIDSDSDFIKQIEDLRRKIRSLEERKGGRNTKIQCWTSGAAGHVRRNSSISRDGGNNLPPHQGKQICGHLEGRRCPESQKSHFKEFHISSISNGDNGFFVMGHVNKVPSRMIIDTGANVTIIITDLAHKLGKKTHLDATLQTVIDNRINIHGKVYLNIAFGDAMYHYMTYVADINDQFYLELDFLKENNFKLDFKNNES